MPELEINCKLSPDGLGTLHFSSEIDAPVESLREWHFRPGAFSRLSPPWEKARIVEDPGGLYDGARAVIEIGIGPGDGLIHQRWIADHEITEEGFIDRQIEGPFASWEHHHRFEAIDAQRSRLTDAISYRLPMGRLGALAGRGFIEAKMKRMFRYRHAVTRTDLERRVLHPPPKSLSVLMTGATGLIGRALTGYLETQGHTVRRVTRTPSQPDDIAWDPDQSILELPKDTSFDAVIHLAGESVAGGRWTAAKRKRIMESRRLGTRLITKAITALPEPPSVFVSASGSGFYPLGTGPHAEGASSGDHYLSQVCQAWEAETAPAEEAGIRVIHARIGAVLAHQGGILKDLLPVFQAGLGGAIGSGEQHLSWIGLSDVVDILHRSTFETGWSGPINLTAPQPVPNETFARTFARALRRPHFFRVPEIAVRALFGEMAEETILADNQVIPEKLGTLGYAFRHPDLGDSITHELGLRPLDD